MVCCKLDKIDKIFISILCIFVTFTCVFNTFCYAYETEIVDNLILRNVGLENSIFEENENCVCITFKVKKGVKYTIKSSTIYENRPSSNIKAYSNEIPQVGEKPFNSSYTSSIFDKPNGVTFTAEYDGYYSYIYTNKNNYDVNGISVTQDTTYMTVAINKLKDNVGVNIWDSFKNLLPYVLVVVTVSLGFYFILHAIREVSKGRDV